MRAVMLVLAGCGRIGFDPTAPPPDDAAVCTTFGPWGMPRLQPISSATVSDLAPTIHPNNLVLVFDRPVGGNRQLFISLRTNVADDFTDATQITTLNPGTIFEPAWSPDGNKLHFHSITGSDERLVTDYLGGTSFGTPVGDNIPGNGDNGTFSADGSELFYTEYLASTAIGYALFDGQNYSEQLTYLQPINTDANDEGYPSLDDGRQTLYYEEQMAATTQAHISTAKRDGPGLPFARIGELADFPQNGSTGDPEVSRDGTTLVFASDDNGPNADIYLSTRPCL